MLKVTLVLFFLILPEQSKTGRARAGQARAWLTAPNQRLGKPNGLCLWSTSLNLRSGRPHGPHLWPDGLNSRLGKSKSPEDEEDWMVTIGCPVMSCCMRDYKIRRDGENSV